MIVSTCLRWKRLSHLRAGTVAVHGPASGRRNSTANGFHDVLSLLGRPLQHRWPRDPEDAGEARDEFGGVAMFGATV